MRNTKDVIHYYHTPGSRLGYRLILGGNKHFGYYPDEKNSISMRQAMVNMQDQLAQELDLRPGMKVLDAGCGMGDAALYIARKYNVQVTGVDLLDFNIAEAKKKLKQGDRVDFVVGDYTNSKLPKSSFDAIYTLETFVHVPDYQAGLKEFYRLLKPSGRLVLFEYSHAPEDEKGPKATRVFYTINKYAAMPGFQRFYHGVLEAELKKAGFKVDKVRDISGKMKPMIRRFWQIAFVPYQFIRLFHLQRFFINATSGYELYKYFDAFRYNVFVAKKLRR